MGRPVCLLRLPRRSGSWRHNLESDYKWHDIITESPRTNSSSAVYCLHAFGQVLECFWVPISTWYNGSNNSNFTGFCVNNRNSVWKAPGPVQTINICEFSGSQAPGPTQWPVLSEESSNWTDLAWSQAQPVTESLVLGHFTSVSFDGLPGKWNDPSQPCRVTVKFRNVLC